MRLKGIHIFFLLLVQLTVQAQEFKDCNYTPFKDGKRSTSVCYSENKYEGIAIAYNSKGDVIGEWKLSRMHVLASVHFTFHSNGGVHKAEYSSHPDAGIQWYRSFTTYDENGVKTDFREESHEDRVLSPSIFVLEDETKEQKKLPEAPYLVTDTLHSKNQEQVKKDSTATNTITCAVIYISELWIDNRTGKDIMVKWDKKYKTDEKENSLSFVKIKKGEKIKLTEQIQAQYYDDPMKILNISIWNSKGKKKLNHTISNTSLIDESRLNDHHKAFIHEVTK